MNLSLGDIFSLLNSIPSLQNVRRKIMIYLKVIESCFFFLFASLHPREQDGTPTVLLEPSAKILPRFSFLPRLLKPTWSDQEIQPQYVQSVRKAGFIKLDYMNFLEWVTEDIYLTAETMLALCT